MVIVSLSHLNVEMNFYSKMSNVMMVIGIVMMDVIRSVD